MSQSDPHEPVSGTGRHGGGLTQPPRHKSRRGKAPPVDPFTGEEPEIRLDDWLPSLERAATWNEWTEGELLLQFAGHLRGRALQEWSLLDEASKETYQTAVESLRLRIDPGGRTLAAQDFRHITQGEKEPVADFIRRLERTFRVAYGHDRMSAETRATLLHGQLQEGLRQEVMRAPAVSGAQTYQELCLASRNEEKRLAELRKRQQYQQASAGLLQQQPNRKTVQPRGNGPESVRTSETRKCYLCHKTGHLARDCKRSRPESSGRRDPRAVAKHVSSKQKPPAGEEEQALLDLLFSSDEESHAGVSTVRVKDQGSQPQCVRVELQGVPVYGLVDSGADITIIGGKLLRRVSSIVKLQKKDLKRPDKVPRNYDQRAFTLHGRMDLDITFAGKTMTTPVYIKLDAEEQLLLSEGVCRQLGIIQYHRDVEPWRNRKETPTVSSEGGVPSDSPEAAVFVPTISIKLVQTLRLPPGQCAVVPVQVEGAKNGATLLLEPTHAFEQESGLELSSTLVQPSADGRTHAVIANLSGFTQRVAPGSMMGQAEEVVVFDQLDVGRGDDPSPELPSCEVVRVDTSQESAARKQKLLEMVERPELLDEEQLACLEEFLVEHHQAFSLDPEERGETDLVQIEIDTGDAAPKRQPVRRMPFAVRQEVAKQLKSMQASGVIRPSSSPWASPVVMVRKKDGTHRFCIDYRRVNAVTKPDLYPLPRIDDLLDQLGKSRFFSTLDLASGYWQIRVHPNSIEKTAFITPQGLFEFQVMPFGLMNAPSVFQRLMQQVLQGLNPEEGPDFVSVYIDDVLVFSHTLTEHLQHLRLVIQRLQKVGLKLKPAKCHFVRQEVEYLGHLITPQGLKPNPKLVAAVQEFPAPCNIREVRQFLGLSSYYRRFIPLFAKTARPLHELTRKGAEFVWTMECQTAFDTLKSKLVQAPVLEYPSFDKPFTLETDASIEGLGAVLSQPQDDGHLHPVAFASRALSPPERNYAITELETLAVVWAMSHFHSYLYGHSVTVFTDHTAVKAVLETPSPSGKHARWWTRVYGCGIQEVKIQYRPGRANTNADALSRRPQAPAPTVGLAAAEVQIAAVESVATGEGARNITELLQAAPVELEPVSFAEEQRKDPRVLEVIRLLEAGELPPDERRARKLALQEHLFVVIDDVLYHLDPKQQHLKQAVVPEHMRGQIMEENHRGPMAGHFSGHRLFNTLSRHWWWEGMYNDARKYVNGCPECTIVSGGGRVQRPPLHPIPVSRPFQIIGVDVMDLPKTALGNKHVLVFQDLFTKWPMVFAIPDQKTERIVRILVDEIIPFCGVPEAFLSDRGTNLLSHLMMDTCELLGIRKLNTTAYHPQCDGLVERYNRTLKTALRKHAARYGVQWDRMLPGVVWAYRNTPHEATHEKPSYLLFGMDCRTPSEAAVLPPASVVPADLGDFREELTVSLASAREIAANSIQQAQKRYKQNYDRGVTEKKYRVGDWVLVKFPADETGKSRKLSRPWHGPYRVVNIRQPDVTVVKVYRPQDGCIQIHQTRVTPCPSAFPAGYSWYGDKRPRPGRPPKWVDRLLQGVTDSTQAGDVIEGDETEPVEDHDLSSEPGDLEEQSYTGERESHVPEAGPITSSRQPESTAARASSHYGLRRRVVPPDRF